MTVGQLLAWCRKMAENGLDGVTISGGEPFDQAPALKVLLQALIAWRSAEGLDFDLLCYSGYPLATLRQKHPQILALLDAIIAEPFIEKLPQTHIWRGSSNQSMTLLTARARDQFQAYLDAAV